MKAKYHGEEIILDPLEDDAYSLDNNDDLNDNLENTIKIPINDIENTIKMKPINLENTLEFDGE